jgi:hypothetical protein
LLRAARSAEFVGLSLLARLLASLIVAGVAPARDARVRAWVRPQPRVLVAGDHGAIAPRMTPLEFILPSLRIDDPPGTLRPQAIIALSVGST